MVKLGMVSEHLRLQSMITGIQIQEPLALLICISIFYILGVSIRTDTINLPSRLLISLMAEVFLKGCLFHLFFNCGFQWYEATHTASL